MRNRSNVQRIADLERQLAEAQRERDEAQASAAAFRNALEALMDRLSAAEAVCNALYGELHDWLGEPKGTISLKGSHAALDAWRAAREKVGK